MMGLKIHRLLEQIRDLLVMLVQKDNISRKERLEMLKEILDKTK